MLKIWLVVCENNAVRNCCRWKMAGMMHQNQFPVLITERKFDLKALKCLNHPANTIFVRIMWSFLTVGSTFGSPPSLWKNQYTRQTEANIDGSKLEFGAPCWTNSLTAGFVCHVVHHFFSKIWCHRETSVKCISNGLLSISCLKIYMNSELIFYIL